MEVAPALVGEDAPWMDVPYRTPCLFAKGSHGGLFAWWMSSPWRFPPLPCSCHPPLSFASPPSSSSLNMVHTEELEQAFLVLGTHFRLEANKSIYALPFWWWTLSPAWTPCVPLHRKGRNVTSVIGRVTGRYMSFNLQYWTIVPNL